MCHVTPTIKEMIGDLNGAKVFTTLDLNQGYNQLKLAPESEYITTFGTHMGLMRYKRLNFGISSAYQTRCVWFWKVCIIHLSIMLFISWHKEALYLLPVLKEGHFLLASGASQVSRTGAAEVQDPFSKWTTATPAGEELSQVLFFCWFCVLLLPLL